MSGVLKSNEYSLIRKKIMDMCVFGIVVHGTISARWEELILRNTKSIFQYGGWKNIPLARSLTIYEEYLEQCQD